MDILIILAMYALWSSVFAICKMTLTHCPLFFLLAIRMLLASAILLGFVAFRNPAGFRLKIRQYFLMGCFGIVGLYLLNALEYWSLQYLSVAKICFLYGLSSFVSAFFSYLHFGEKMNRRKWCGLAIGFLGVIPVLSIQTGSEDLVGGVFHLSWPEIAVFGAVISSSYGWILLRMTLKDTSLPVSNGIGMLVAGLFALVHSYFFEQWNPMPVWGDNLKPFLTGLIAIILISNVICNNIYGLMLKRYSATFLAFMGMPCPFFASLTGWLLRGEPVSPVIFISTGVMIFGLWLVYSAEFKQGYIRNNRPVNLSQ